MRKIFTGLVMTVLALFVVTTPVMVTMGDAFAAPTNMDVNDGGGGGYTGTPTAESTNSPNAPGGGGATTSILPSDWGVSDILKLILNIVVYGLGAAAVLGVIIAGIMYMTARDNEAQVAKAKTRLFEVVIGLVAWAVMFAVLNWLIPGGLVGVDENDNIQDDTRGYIELSEDDLA